MCKRHDILENLSDGQVAQLVEHATENRSVGGSIPSLATNLRSDCRRRLPTIARQSVRERRWVNLPLSELRSKLYAALIPP